MDLDFNPINNTIISRSIEIIHSRSQIILEIAFQYNPTLVIFLEISTK